MSIKSSKKVKKVKEEALLVKLPKYFLRSFFAHKAFILFLFHFFPKHANNSSKEPKSVIWWYGNSLINIDVLFLDLVIKRTEEKRREDWQMLRMEGLELFSCII